MGNVAALYFAGADVTALAGLHRKMEKYPKMIILTKTTLVGQTLDGIDKLLVICHGSKVSPYLIGITPDDLAELISKTNFKQGKLRLESCYAASDLTNGAAPLVVAALKKKNLANILVTGVTGVNIIAWDAKRGVLDEECLPAWNTLNHVLSILHEAEWKAAKDLATKWKENLDSQAIALLASKVATKIQPCFDDLRKVLTHDSVSMLLKGKENYRKLFASYEEDLALVNLS
jgi:hypothetical protein